MNNHDLSVQKAVLSDFRKSCRFPDLLLLFAKIPCNSPILVSMHLLSLLLMHFAIYSNEPRKPAPAITLQIRQNLFDRRSCVAPLLDSAMIVANRCMDYLPFRYNT